MKLIIDIPDKYISIDTNVKEWIDKAGNDCKVRPLPKGHPIDILDKIRAEMDEQIKYNTYFNSDMAKGEIIAFEWVKRKMDEHGKEQE